MGEAERIRAAIAAEMQLGELEIARRLALLRLSSEDRALLAELAPRVKAEARAVVDGFYTRLRSERELGVALPRGAAAEALKRRLERYLIAVFTGPHDEDYASHRLLVGVTHQEHRIRPKWYISATGWLLSALMEVLHPPQAEPAEAPSPAMMAAIFKALLFDLSLVLETYFHADHQAIEQLATHDRLTGLPNYYLLQERLTERYGGDDGPPVCVLLIGLNRFKAINAALGHDVGDRLLGQVAERLSATVGSGGMLARLGGDLFVVLCEQCGATGVPRATMERILSAFEVPFDLDELSVNVHATVGVAVGSVGGSDPSTLLRQSEAALLHAKSRRSTHAVYGPQMERYSVEQVRLIGELRTALEAGQLRLFYQPKIDVKRAKICGVEALIRWRHPGGELRLPSRFIPVAEQTVLIHPLTDFVVEAAAEQAARWRARGIELPVSINIAAPNLLNAELPRSLEQVLEAHGLSPAGLVLELTESTLMVDPPRARATLLRLRQLGFELSIDDFGTGYSSLAYLRTLPVSEIKLDRSFVMGMERDERDARIVEALIGLAHGLHMTVTAEGVETEGAWRMLTALGTDRAQGFFLAEPQSATELERWLEQSPFGLGE